MKITIVVARRPTGLALAAASAAAAGSDLHGRMSHDLNIVAIPEEGRLGFWEGGVLDLLEGAPERVYVLDFAPPLNLDRQVLFQVVRRFVDNDVELHVMDSHHRGQPVEWRTLAEAGARVKLSSSVRNCYPKFQGGALKTARRWGQLAGICSRDPASAPNGSSAEDKERLETLLAWADTLEWQLEARWDEFLSRALIDDLEYLQLEKLQLPKVKGEIYITEPNDVLRVMSPLQCDIALPQLREIVARRRVKYAVGICRCGEKFRVLAVRNWRDRSAVPVTYKLGYFSQRYLSTTRGYCFAEADDEASANRIADEMERRLSDAPVDHDRDSESPLALVSSLMRNVLVPYYFTEHGLQHVMRVLGYMTSLLGFVEVTESERKCLIYAALMHDIGLYPIVPLHGSASLEFGFRELEESECTADMMRDIRDLHHVRSSQIVRYYWAQGRLPQLNEEEAALVAYLCEAHRARVPLPEDARTRLLVALVRAADVMDVTFIRAQKSDKRVPFEVIAESSDVPECEREHWIGHRMIRDIRLNVTGRLMTVVIVAEQCNDAANVQIRRVQEDLAPLSEALSELYHVSVIAPDGDGRW